MNPTPERGLARVRAVERARKEVGLLGDIGSGLKSMPPSSFGGCAPISPPPPKPLPASPVRSSPSTMAAVAPPATPDEIRAASYVGFDCPFPFLCCGLPLLPFARRAHASSFPPLVLLPPAITQQIEHKLLKRGFQFNVIVVGQSLPCFACVESRLELNRKRVMAGENRPDGSGQVNIDQHALRLAPDRLQGSTRGRGGDPVDDRDRRQQPWCVSLLVSALGGLIGREDSLAPPTFPSFAALEKLRT